LDASKERMGPMPLWPSTHPSQKASFPTPFGATTPTPEMTTLRMILPRSAPLHPVLWSELVALVIAPRLPAGSVRLDDRPVIGSIPGFTSPQFPIYPNLCNFMLVTSRLQSPDPSTLKRFANLRRLRQQTRYNRTSPYNFQVPHRTTKYWLKDVSGVCL
jgi:hypothetical protein